MDRGLELLVSAIKGGLSPLSSITSGQWFHQSCLRNGASTDTQRQGAERFPRREHVDILGAWHVHRAWELFCPFSIPCTVHLSHLAKLSSGRQCQNRSPSWELLGGVGKKPTLWHCNHTSPSSEDPVENPFISFYHSLSLVSWTQD